MPREPYIISGTVFQSDGSISASTKVRLIHEPSGEIQEFTTNSQGQYVFDMANFTTAWVEGDYFKVVAIGDTSKYQDLRLKIKARDIFQVSQLKVKYKT